MRARSWIYLCTQICDISESKNFTRLRCELNCVYICALNWKKYNFCLLKRAGASLCASKHLPLPKNLSEQDAIKAK